MKNTSEKISHFLKRGRNKSLRLAVTGLSQAGKTTFITSLINQLLNANQTAMLPLFSASKRIIGTQISLHRNMTTSRFAYEKSYECFLGASPQWPAPTEGISEITLNIRYQSRQFLSRQLSQYQQISVELIDYPGEWLLDLPMLEQDYFQWSSNLLSYIDRHSGQVTPLWLNSLKQIDPLAPVDEAKLADIAKQFTEYLFKCKDAGLHFIQPGRFILPGELANTPILQFFPWPITDKEEWKFFRKAQKCSNIAVLINRYQKYGKVVVKRFYLNYFSQFDRQIILVDCLTALNKRRESFNDLRYAIGQLTKSFNYGKRNLLRRLFSPCIDKLLFSVTKIDHITPEQHHNLLQLLDLLVSEAKQHAQFEGISIQSLGIASVKATKSGFVNYQNKNIPAIKGIRQEDNKLITVYPGEVPSYLPNEHFWSENKFDFQSFKPMPLTQDNVLPHIRLDSVLEFLLGDRMK